MKNKMKQRKARIITIKIGQLTYYRPQIQRKYLGFIKKWIGIDAFECDGSIYYHTACNYNNIKSANSKLIAYSKLTNEKIIIV
ncbi:MAG: hypothetical protein H8E98_03830 [Bacteroidetes bacterium]|nr:hypothetical protein [Bacteroidota bacterium]